MSLIPIGLNWEVTDVTEASYSGPSPLITWKAIFNPEINRSTMTTLVAMHLAFCV